MVAKVQRRPPGVLEVRISANPLPWALGLLAGIAFTIWADVGLGLVASGFAGWVLWGQRASVLTLDRDQGHLRVVTQGLLGGPWGAVFREVRLDRVDHFRVIQRVRDHVDGFGLRVRLTSGEEVELCADALSFAQVHAWETHLRELLGPHVRVEAVG